jgi:hypothetical protein
MHPPADDLAAGPYARFWRPHLAALPPHVAQALLAGPLAPSALPSLAAAPTLLVAGDWPVETGYTLAPAGDARIFVRTLMPGVTPPMWDWWFAWHGSESARYRLWHPQAHVAARWADGLGELPHYVGRTSHVDEFIGATMTKLAIRFVPPESLGLDATALADRERHVAICARAGPRGVPIDAGWLVHHVRAVAGGSEMRSRFWIGGPYVQTKLGTSVLAKIAGRAASGATRPTRAQAADLLVHCAQEMNHLAAVLPDLYAAFGPRAAREVAG